MITLALDVDGVLLDSDRSGKGDWTNELEKRLGITPAAMRDEFFARFWDDIVRGRRSVEDGLSEALTLIDTTADVESVLSCWFEADFVPIEATLELARQASQFGCRVVLATDQEHRRADYLQRRLASLTTLDGVFYSADVGYTKRDRRFFDAASSRLGVSADERQSVVFVDDRSANVDVARKTGWQAVHAAPGEPWQEEVAEILGLPQ